MKTRVLGQELSTSAVALGAMGLSGGYEATEEESAIQLIHEALDHGVTMIDTADFYGKGERSPDSEWGHNEKLVGKGIKGRRDELVIATKVGLSYLEDGSIGPNGRPEYIKAAVEGSLQRLGVDVIDLYYLHRVDPDVPVEESIGAMAELVQAGKVRHLGISEPSEESLRKAHAVHPMTALQSEYSLATRDVEEDMLPLCRELGIGFVAFASLGRGLLTGTLRDAPDDARRSFPRFQSPNFEKNLALVDQLGVIANRLGVSIPQVAIAWLLTRDEHLVPLFGALTRPDLEHNAQSASVELSPEDVAQISEIWHPSAVQGGRYPEAWLANTRK